jgi:delta(3,5)-delta(2,4)-dienoyl-CoA isomerase
VRSTKFSIKEVDIGLAADIGTLSRLPKIGLPYSWAKEAAYTARIFSGEEALSVGFVSRVFETKEDMVTAAIETAGLIAQKSPVAVQSTKALLDYSRDHTVEEGLRYTSVWNSAMIQAEDVTKATMSGLRKTKPTFEKL